MFDNGDLVLGAVDKLLRAYYPEAIDCEIDDLESSFPEQEEQADSSLEMPARPITVYEDPPGQEADDSRSNLQASQARWRSTMYGVDEEDLEFLQENQPPVVEEEEGFRDVAVSNPWTIALINAATKSKKPLINRQLLSPAKSLGDVSMPPSSPAPSITPRRVSSAVPLTPQTSSQTNIRPSLDAQLEQSIQHLPQCGPLEQPSIIQATSMPDRLRRASIPPSEAQRSSSVAGIVRRPDQSLVDMSQPSFVPVRSVRAPDFAQESSALRRKQKKQPASANGPFIPPSQDADNTWFVQPLRGSQPFQPRRRQKQQREQAIPFSASDISSGPRRAVLTAANRLMENHSESGNNIDIRDYFGQHQRGRAMVATGPSFAAINAPPQRRPNSRPIPILYEYNQLESFLRRALLAFEAHQ